MAGDDELVEIRIRLKDARRFQTDAKGVSRHVADIGDKADRTGRRMRAASLAARGFGVGIGAMAKAAKYGAVALTAMSLVGIGASISAFAESEAVMADQAAALKSTGASAWITSRALQNLAAVQSMRTGVDDEAISSAQTMLLTFTKVRNAVGKGNDIFTQANGIVGDFAVRFKKDLPGAAILVGKALNDPIKGVGALSKVGVQFDAQQKAQIKTMMEAGNVLGAQKIIMGELSTQTKGAAEAYGKTLAGSMARAKVIVGNIAEAFGGWLAPGIKSAVDMAAKFGIIVQTQIGRGASPIDAVTTAFGRLFGWQSRVMQVWKTTQAIAAGLWASLQDVGAGARDLLIAFNPFAGASGQGTGDALQRIGDMARSATQHFRAFGKWMRKGGTGAETLKGGLMALAAGVVAYKVAMLAATAATKAFMVIQAVGKAVMIAYRAFLLMRAGVSAWTIAQLLLNTALIANPIGLIVAGVIALGVGVFVLYKKVGWFRAAVQGVFGWLKKNWKLLFVIITGPVGLAVLMVVKYWDKIKDGFGAAIGWIKKHWRLVVIGLTGPVGAVVIAIVDHWGKIKDGFGSMIKWIAEKWNSLADKLSFKAKKFKGHTIMPGFSLPTVDVGNLAGGGILRAGSSFVGEHGPELASVTSDGVRIDPLPNRLANRVRGMVPDPFAGMAPAPAGGGDGPGTWEVHVYIDGDKVNTKLAKVVKRKAARK